MVDYQQSVILWWYRKKVIFFQRKVFIMRKMLMIAAATVLVGALAGCGSLRTPTKGPRKNNVYYSTFFGLSLESAVYGDGIIVNQK